MDGSSVDGYLFVRVHHGIGVHASAKRLVVVRGIVGGFTVALFAFSQATMRFFADSFVDRHSPSGVAEL